MKKTMIVMAFALAAPLLAQEATRPAQEATKAAPAAATQADPVIMKMGEIEIHASEFEQALEALPAEYRGDANGPGKRQFAEDYLRLRVLAATAEKEGLANDPKVKAQLKLLRENTLANAQLEKMRGSIKIEEAESKKIYEERKGQMEQAKARHILIAFEGSPAAPPTGALKEEDAKKKAEEIRAKIAGGADFAELAKTESNDPGSGARGGDLGQFSRGQMVPEFDQAVFAAKAGELTPVVRTQFGYHVIQVQEKGVKPFEEVREQIETELRQQKLEALVEGAQSTAKATLVDEYFGAPEPPVKPAAAPAPGK
ncbi:MAG TPA: peptidylprolyl isomerase [Thermoanaerobaculia bacterium]